MKVLLHVAFPYLVGFNKIWFLHPISSVFQMITHSCLKKHSPQIPLKASLNLCFHFLNLYNEKKYISTLLLHCTFIYLYLSAPFGSREHQSRNSLPVLLLQLPKLQLISYRLIPWRIINYPVPSDTEGWKQANFFSSWNFKSTLWTSGSLMFVGTKRFDYHPSTPHHITSRLRW